MPDIDAAPPRVRRSLKLHRDLTEEELKKYGPVSVDALFKSYNRGVNEIWEDYIVLKFYLQKSHDLLKDKKVDRAIIPKLIASPRQDPQSTKVLYGVIDRILRKSSGYHAFIDAVSEFEYLMSALVTRVYMDYSGKLRGLVKDAEEETSTRKKKLLDLIIDSKDKYAMLQKLTEEKVRGIFYKDPMELFVGDKARLEFGNYFKENHQDALKRLEK